MVTGELYIVKDEDFETKQAYVFEADFEDKEDRVRKDVIKLGKSLRIIQRVVRKYFMFKRLNLRLVSRKLDTNIKEREEEITKPDLKFITRI